MENILWNEINFRSLNGAESGGMLRLHRGVIPKFFDRLFEACFISATFLSIGFYSDSVQTESEKLERK